MTRRINYQKTMTCRLSENDAILFEGQAQSLGLTKSQYLRYLIRTPERLLEYGGTILVVDNRSVAAMRRELVRWGHHYNQGIHALNSIAFGYAHNGQDKEYFASQIAAALIQLEETHDGACEVAEELEKLSQLPRCED